MKAFKSAETVSLSQIDTIQHPELDEDIDLTSSAFEVFVDFNKQQPFLLEQSASISHAAEIMQKEHVRRKLVIDNHEHLLGVVSLADLMSAKVMKAMETTGMKREDLTVADVMVHKDTLRAVVLKVFEKLTIGDVLLTMKQFGEEHLLVVNDEERSLVGIVSSTDIARRLHRPVNINERPPSFRDMFGRGDAFTN